MLRRIMLIDETIDKEIQMLYHTARNNADILLNRNCNEQFSIRVIALQNILKARREILGPTTREGDNSFRVLNADNECFSEFLFLHDMLQKLPIVAITHGTQTLTGSVDISIFCSVRELEIKHVPIRSIKGLNKLEDQIESLIVRETLDKPSDILSYERCSTWKKLININFSHNYMTQLDSSISKILNLEILEITNNKLIDLTPLETLPNLIYLRLSYNKIKHLPRLHRNTSRTLKCFKIAFNRLESLKGIELYMSLEEFDCSFNVITQHCDLKYISNLKNLRRLWINDNPIYYHKKHRILTAKYIHPSVENFELNGEFVTKKEKRWIGMIRLESMESPMIDDQSPSITPIVNLSQDKVESSRKISKIRSADIIDLDVSQMDKSVISNSSLSDTDQENVETKSKIEKLRSQLGDDWLKNLPRVFEDEVATAAVACGYIQTDKQIIDADVTNQLELALAIEGVTENITSKSVEKEKIIDILPELEYTEEEQEEDDDDKYVKSVPYFVQRYMIDPITGKNTIKDFLLVLQPSKLVERDVDDAKIIAKWPLDILESFEYIAKDKIRLKFKTVRRHLREREYILEPTVMQDLCSMLGTFLQVKSLQNPGHSSYTCMNCSTYFATEMNDTETNESRITCPNCNSAVVLTSDGKQPLLKKSASESSLGTKHLNENLQPCTYSSLDQYKKLSKYTDKSGNDSDIEVISNPSQSSIEVIVHHEDTHSRENSVDIIADNKNKNVANIGLTESSSSGSMTDSVCTAYESSHMIQPSSSLTSAYDSYMQKATTNLGQLLVYSYADFTKVDHRLKLYLCMKLFNQENEYLLSLLRCWIIDSPDCNNKTYSGLLIITNENVYVLKITGYEGDNPESWLIKEGSWPLSQLVAFNMTFWKYGIEMIISTNDKDTIIYEFLLGDLRYSIGFIQDITTKISPQCDIRQFENEKILINSESVTHISIATGFTKIGDGISNNGPVLIAVTDTYIGIKQDDLKSCLSSIEINADLLLPICRLLDVSKSTRVPWILRLKFSGETNTEDYNVTISFISRKSQINILEALKIPWQNFFQVSLLVSIID